MQGWEFWTVAVFVAVIVGFSKGGWSAIGNLSVPILSLVIDPLSAAGLLLPVYLVSDVFGLWAYRHSFDRRVLAILIPAGLIGVGIGWAVVPWMDAHLRGGERIITGLVGLIGIGFSAYMLCLRSIERPVRQAEVLPGLLWGALAGFTSYIAHAGAPPFQTYVQPLRLDRLRFAGTTTILFAIINLAKLGPYWANGQVNADSLNAAVWLGIPAVVGVFIGKSSVGWVSQETFYKVITWALMIIGLELVGKAVSGVDPLLSLLHVFVT